MGSHSTHVPNEFLSEISQNTNTFSHAQATNFKSELLTFTFRSKFPHSATLKSKTCQCVALSCPFCLYSVVCPTKTALRTRHERRGATHTSLERTFVFRMAIHHDWYVMSIFLHSPFLVMETLSLGSMLLPKHTLSSGSAFCLL